MPERERGVPERRSAVEPLPPADATAPAGAGALLVAARRGRGGGRALAAAVAQAQATAGNRALGRVLQRRIKARGDVAAFIGIAAPATRLGLSYDDATGVLSVSPGDGKGVRSPSFRRLLLDIAGSSTDAELNFGRRLPGVLVGSFPKQGRDPQGRLEQLIDLDDVEAVERGAPGNGLAKLAHEIAENHHAHLHPVSEHAPEGERFEGAHFGGGVPAEEAVLRDVGVGGERMAERTLWGADRSARGFVVDYGSYLLLQEISRERAPTTRATRACSAYSPSTGAR